MLFHRNGRAVKDDRGAWKKVTEGIKGGSGKSGRVTIHDLRRSAITGMANKSITTDKAGTHLSSDVFRRYIQLSDEEQQEIASVIERD